MAHPILFAALLGGSFGWFPMAVTLLAAYAEDGGASRRHWGVAIAATLMGTVTGALFAYAVVG